MEAIVVHYSCACSRAKPRSEVKKSHNRKGNYRRHHQVLSRWFGHAHNMSRSPLILILTTISLKLSVRGAIAAIAGIFSASRITASLQNVECGETEHYCSRKGNSFVPNSLYYTCGTIIWYHLGSAKQTPMRLLQDLSSFSVDHLQC